MGNKISSKWGVYGLIKEVMVRDGVFMMKKGGY